MKTVVAAVTLAFISASHAFAACIVVGCPIPSQGGGGGGAAVPGPIAGVGLGYLLILIAGAVYAKWRKPVP